MLQEFLALDFEKQMKVTSDILLVAFTLGLCIATLLLAWFTRSLFQSALTMETIANAQKNEIHGAVRRLEILAGEGKKFANHAESIRDLIELGGNELQKDRRFRATMSFVEQWGRIVEGYPLTMIGDFLYAEIDEPKFAKLDAGHSFEIDGKHVDALNAYFSSINLPLDERRAHRSGPNNTVWLTKPQVLAMRRGMNVHLNFYESLAAADDRSMIDSDLVLKEFGPLLEKQYISLALKLDKEPLSYPNLQGFIAKWRSIAAKRQRG